MNEAKQQRLFFRILSIYFLLLVFSGGRGNCAEPNIKSLPLGKDDAIMVVKHDISDNETVYSISSKDCTIKLIARNSEIGVIKQWSQCTALLADQIPLLTKIYAEFFSKDKNAQIFRTLFWGRLELDNPNVLRELSLRLALASHKSPGWDGKRGRPKNGDINGFVKELANRAMIYPELKELFEGFHKRIQFSCAEKVLVLKAEKLPFFDQLKRQGVKGSDRLPFDCMAWFSVSAIIEK